jgi:hypothetical protein
MRGYPSSCCPREHQPTRPQARRSPAWCSGGSYFCPATCCSWLPLQGEVNNRLRGGPRASAAWYPSLRPSASEGGQWPDEGPPWMPNSVGFQEGDQVLFYRPTRTRGKSPKLPAVLGRPTHGYDPDQRRGLPNPATSEAKMMVTHFDTLLLGTGSLKEGAVSQGPVTRGLLSPRVVVSCEAADRQSARYMSATHNFPAVSTNGP